MNIAPAYYGKGSEPLWRDTSPDGFTPVSGDPVRERGTQLAGLGISLNEASGLKDRVAELEKTVRELIKKLEEVNHQVEFLIACRKVEQPIDGFVKLGDMPRDTR